MLENLLELQSVIRALNSCSETPTTKCLQQARQFVHGSALAGHCGPHPDLKLDYSFLSVTEQNKQNTQQLPLESHNAPDAAETFMERPQAEEFALSDVRTINELSDIPPYQFPKNEPNAPQAKIQPTGSRYEEPLQFLS